MIEQKIDNVDKVFCIKAKNSQDVIEDLFVFSSEDQWTSINAIEGQEFQDKTSEFEINAGQFTLLCTNIKENSLLFVSHNNITLLRIDGKTVVTSIEEFEEGADIKTAWLYEDQ